MVDLVESSSSVDRVYIILDSGTNYGGTVVSGSTGLGAVWFNLGNATGSNDDLYASWAVP
jgi:hypothetical protein